MSQPVRIGGGESYTGFFIDWIEQWSQFFTACNWRTFHVAQFEIEDDRIMGGVEATIILFGVGFRARWNYERTDRVEEISKSVEAIRASLGDDLDV